MEESQQPKYRLKQCPPEDEGTHDSIYVQHITGYKWTQRLEDRNAHILKSYGFVRLRSEPETGKDGKKEYWEIWFLPGMWALPESARKNNPTPQDMVRTIMNEVTPGTIELNGRHWGLGVE